MEVTIETMGSFEQFDQRMAEIVFQADSETTASSCSPSGKLDDLAEKEKAFQATGPPTLKAALSASGDYQRRLVAGAAQTTNRTDERGAGGRWAGRRHRLTRTDDEDGSFGSLRRGPMDDSTQSCEGRTAAITRR
jgi:hypothetical protein